jgi:putative transport protein
MNWLVNLFMGNSVAHSLLVLALVICVGSILSHIKIKGVSIGSTWVLFVGIIVSHFGMVLDDTTLHFAKEFGLIIFIYTIGLQVGPSFFSSFRSGGVKLNLLAAIFVLLGCCTTYILHLITGMPLSTMVGVQSGAVTNTPALGAAQQTLMDVTGAADNTMAMGYAIAYPLGTLSVIVAIIIIKSLFRIDIPKEKERAEKNLAPIDKAKRLVIKVTNENIFGKSIQEIDKMVDKHFVVSRVIHENGQQEVLSSGQTVINNGDKLLIITAESQIDQIVSFIGKRLEYDDSEWSVQNTDLVVKKVLVTKTNINGRTLGDLRIRSSFGVNITRVMRSGVDLPATVDLMLQLGDKVLVVGPSKSVDKAADFLGNSQNQLWEPNLIPIFLGIFLGVLVGSIPMVFPGISQPVKLGLAGGPLVVAILISRFGPQYHLATYATIGATKMLRELGISLFMACVGLGSGQGFVETVVNGGYMWILYGLIITIVPILLVSILARFVHLLNAESPILVTLLPITTLSRLLHSKNALSPMIFTPLPILTLSRFAQ